MRLWIVFERFKRASTGIVGSLSLLSLLHKIADVIIRAATIRRGMNNPIRYSQKPAKPLIAFPPFSLDHAMTFFITIV